MQPTHDPGIDPADGTLGTAAFRPSRLWPRGDYVSCLPSTGVSGSFRQRYAEIA
ncbi:hypothetical protein [Paenibacillus chitinolyticus]|uniref:hypothetical protein n=1 Tax=Paenibacillus chitinolyticus TaxID=79263 RepID=UPI003666467C